MKLRFLWCALAALLVLIGCSDTGSDVSLPQLEITTSTTGSAPDSNGYSATIDGGPPWAIGDNDTLTIGDLSTGDHVVELSGLANNCQVGGWNSRSVTLTSGGGVIFHLDGSAWARADSSITPDLFGMWGGSAVDAFAVGDSGVILDGTP
jgi:hypothetical protein